MDDKNLALEFRGISKVYPNGVVANNNINMKVYQGEIHGLIGENGAGKSTLMKVLFGTEKPTSGEIFINGRKEEIDSPSKAIDLGIGMVHQHFMLVDTLTIAENIFLGAEPRKNRFFLDKTKMVEEAQALANRYQFNIDVKKKISESSVAIKQETEILKALSKGAKILILDEPTAVLTPQETDKLFEELIHLKENGHTIIFISHKLNEVKEICDNITILRNGTTIETVAVDTLSAQEISNKMVGRDVVLAIEKGPANFGTVVLEAKNLSYTNELGKKTLDDVSFKLREGEILAIAGVEGNGQRELVGIITGNLEKESGELIIGGEILQNASVKRARDAGITYIPADRLETGVARYMPIRDNLIPIRLDDYANGMLIDYEKVDRDSENLIKDFRVKATSPYQETGMLSGGNIQKVVAARELTDDLKVVVAEQPTRGIDPGAAELIRQKLIELRDNGKAIILVSADLNEILELADTSIVMNKGKINAYFDNTEKLTEEELGYYMLGVKNMDDVEARL